jgi:hypothetical protein
MGVMTIFLCSFFNAILIIRRFRLDLRLARDRFFTKIWVKVKNGKN